MRMCSLKFDVRWKCMGFISAFELLVGCEEGCWRALHFRNTSILPNAHLFVLRHVSLLFFPMSTLSHVLVAACLLITWLYSSNTLVLAQGPSEKGAHKTHRTVHDVWSHKHVCGTTLHGYPDSGVHGRCAGDSWWET